MKPIIILSACLLLIAAWSPAPARSAEMPKADAAALWNYITKISPYRGWKQWPDYKGSHQSRSPHGETNQVWADKTAMSAQKPPLPAGSIQVKEAYDGQGKLVNISAMYKVPGYNPSAGDWFWVLYGPGGKVKQSGKPRGCIGCHGVKADNDFVTVHTFK